MGNYDDMNLNAIYEDALANERLRNDIFCQHPFHAGGIIERADKKDRPRLFQEFLRELSEHKIQWSSEEFFSMEPLVEAGMEPEDILQSIIDYSGDIHWMTYELFRDRELFDELRLNVDVRKYVGDFLKGAFLYSEESAFDTVRQFCRDYGIPVEDAIFKAPIGYILKSVYDGDGMLDELIDLLGQNTGEDSLVNKYITYFVGCCKFPEEDDATYTKIRRIYFDLLDDYRGPFSIVEANRERIEEM